MTQPKQSPWVTIGRHRRLEVTQGDGTTSLLTVTSDGGGAYWREGGMYDIFHLFEQDSWAVVTRKYNIHCGIEKGWTVLGESHCSFDQAEVYLKLVLPST